MPQHSVRTFAYRHDGLRLAGRLHGSLDEGRLPFVCLPGLTRNSRDFDAFAEAVRAGARPRPAIAFDYRGRGRSEWAAEPAAYTVPNETDDVLAGLAALGVARAIFVGTSRGALIVHILAGRAPQILAGAILNDAGPRIEAVGLRLIRDYVGRLGPFATWDAAASALADISRTAFPLLGQDDYRRMARAQFVERDGAIVADHDPRLAETLAAADLDRDLPELWDAFDALSTTPLLVVRGENSRLFSAATVEQMQSRHPDMEALVALGQGHAPLLETPEIVGRIQAFAERVDPPETIDHGDRVNEDR